MADRPLRRPKRLSNSPRKRLQTKSVPSDRLIRATLPLETFGGSSGNQAQLLQAHEDLQLSRRSRTTDLIGSEHLQSIDTQRSSIAELRPVRRKLKWQAPSDREQQGSNVRVQALNLGDLDLHGSAPLSSSSEQPNTTITTESKPPLSVEEMERQIRRCRKVIKRCHKELQQDREAIRNVQDETQQLRKQLVASAGDTTTKQLAQEVERLQIQSRQLDEQLGQLVEQKRKLVDESTCMRNRFQHERLVHVTEHEDILSVSSLGDSSSSDDSESEASLVPEPAHSSCHEPELTNESPMRIRTALVD